MSKDNSKKFDGYNSELEQLLSQLLKQLQIQSELLSKIMVTGKIDNCLLEKIGNILCSTTNEAHRQTKLHMSIHRAIDTLIEMCKSAHPEQTALLDKIEKIRDELLKLRPSDEIVDLICDCD